MQKKAVRLQEAIGSQSSGAKRTRSNILHLYICCIISKHYTFICHTF